MHHLNVLGEACPLPVLRAIAMMRKLAVGEVLELVGDDPGMLEDIPQWCAHNGHELLEIDDDLGVVTCRIRKGG